jgi:hypothetical protein
VVPVSTSAATSVAAGPLADGVATPKATDVAALGHERVFSTRVGTFDGADENVQEVEFELSGTS